MAKDDYDIDISDIMAYVHTDTFCENNHRSSTNQSSATSRTLKYSGRLEVYLEFFPKFSNYWESRYS